MICNVSNIILATFYKPLEAILKCTITRIMFINPNYSMEYA